MYEGGELRVETQRYERQCSGCRKWFWAWAPGRTRCYFCQPLSSLEVTSFMAGLGSGNGHGNGAGHNAASVVVLVHGVPATGAVGGKPAGASCALRHDRGASWMERAMRRVAVLLAVAICAAALTAPAALAALAPDPQTIQNDIAVKRGEMMSRALLLPRAEWDAFWPLNRDYERERTQLDARATGLVEDYMKSYQTLGDAKAQELLHRLFELHEQRLALLHRYAAQLQAKLPAPKAAGFVLTEFQLLHLLDYQRTDALGLIR